MTQRIFDVDNPQDIKDLFDVLPDKVKTVIKDTFDNEQIELYDRDDIYIGFCSYFQINWHNKKEITRPVDESEWVGCLCWFWDEYPKDKHLGILEKIETDYDRPYRVPIDRGYQYCRPVRRDEIKFVEDVA